MHTLNYSPTFQSSSSRNISNRGPLIAVIKIQLNQQKIDKIYLHLNDNDQIIAEQFIQKHNLNKQLTKHIYQRIRNSREMLLINQNTNRGKVNNNQNSFSNNNVNYINQKTILKTPHNNYSPNKQYRQDQQQYSYQLNSQFQQYLNNGSIALSSVKKQQKYIQQNKNNNYGDNNKISRKINKQKDIYDISGLKLIDKNKIKNINGSNKNQPYYQNKSNQFHNNNNLKQIQYQSSQQSNGLFQKSIQKNYNMENIDNTNGYDNQYQNQYQNKYQYKNKQKINKYNYNLINNNMNKINKNNKVQYFIQRSENKLFNMDGQKDFIENVYDHKQRFYNKNILLQNNNNKLYLKKKAQSQIQASNININHQNYNNNNNTNIFLLPSSYPQSNTQSFQYISFKNPHPNKNINSNKQFKQFKSTQNQPATNHIQNKKHPISLSQQINYQYQYQQQAQYPQHNIKNNNFNNNNIKNNNNKLLSYRKNQFIRTPIKQNIYNRNSVMSNINNSEDIDDQETKRNIGNNKGNNYYCQNNIQDQQDKMFNQIKDIKQTYYYKKKQQQNIQLNGQQQQQQRNKKSHIKQSKQLNITSRPTHVKILHKQEIQSIKSLRSSNLSHSLSKSQINKINQNVTNRLYNQNQIKKKYLDRLKQKAKNVKNQQELQMEQLRQKPEINNLSKAIAEGRKKNNQTLEEYLFEKAKERQIKLQEMISQQARKKLQKCSFHPYISELSNKLATSRSRSRISTLSQVKQTNKNSHNYPSQNTFKPSINKLSDQIAKTKGTFQERQYKFQQQKNGKLFKKIQQQRLKQKSDSLSGQLLYQPTLNQNTKRIAQKNQERRENQNIYEYLYQLSKKYKQVPKVNHNPVINEQSQKLVLQTQQKRIIWLFSQLDSDQDGIISSRKICIDSISTQILQIIAPILYQMQELSTQLNLQDFKNAIKILNRNIDPYEKSVLYNYSYNHNHGKNRSKSKGKEIYYNNINNRNNKGIRT